MSKSPGASYQQPCFRVQDNQCATFSPQVLFKKDDGNGEERKLNMVAVGELSLPPRVILSAASYTTPSV